MDFGLKLGGGGNSCSGSKSRTCSQETSELESDPLDSLLFPCFDFGSGILVFVGVKISFLLGRGAELLPHEDAVEIR